MVDVTSSSSALFYISTDMLIILLQGKLPFFVAPPKVLIEGVETGAQAMEGINDNDEDVDEEDDDEVANIDDGQNIVDEEEVDSIYDSDDDNIVDDDGDEVESDDDDDNDEEDDDEEEDNRANHVDAVLEPTLIKDKRQVPNSHHVVWWSAATVKENVVTTD